MCAIDRELCDLESSLKYVKDYDNAEAFIQENKETIDKINELFDFPEDKIKETGGYMLT